MQYLSSGKTLALTPRFSPPGDSAGLHLSTRTAIRRSTCSVWAAQPAEADQRRADVVRAALLARWLHHRVLGVESAAPPTSIRADVGGGNPTQLTSGAAIDTSPELLARMAAASSSRAIAAAARSSTSWARAAAARSASPMARASIRRRSGRPRAISSPITRQSGGQFHIGIMKPDGSGERLLSSSSFGAGGPDLGAERPGHHVLPRSGRRRRPGALVGRHLGPQRAAASPPRPSPPTRAGRRCGPDGHSDIISTGRRRGDGRAGDRAAPPHFRSLPLRGERSTWMLVTGHRPLHLCNTTEKPGFRPHSGHD